MEARDEITSPEAKPVSTFGWKGAFGLAIWVVAILFAAWSGGGTFGWTEQGNLANPSATTMDAMVVRNQ